MNITELLRWQWEGYPRYHRSRRNLLLHIVLVPLFIFANISLVVALIQRSWLMALVAVSAMIASIALQGRGHGAEAIPPEPFTGAANAISRIFLEQWLTFPRFVLSRGWLNALRHASAP